MDLNENCNLSGRKSVLCPPHNAFIPSDEEGFVRQPIPYRDYDLSPVDPKLPSIHVLVDDVLIKILEYLSLKKRIHCEIICRRWQALLYGMFQSTTEISLPESYFDDVSKPMLSKILLLTGKKLKSLTLISIDYTLKMKLFLTIAQLCPNLEYLDVSNLQNLSFDHVGDLKDCKNLRIFSANKCLNLNDTSFKELITVLPGLEKIFIESTELTGDYFDLLPEGLKELNINSCLRVSTENLHKVCRACKNLEILEIEILDIDKEFYEELGVNCTNLRSLKVFFPRSDVDVSKQIKSLSKLTKLTIFATTFELPNIADSVKNLEELHIHIRQETINMIDFSKFQQLKNVCLTFSPFRKQELMSLGKCRNLEHITIEGYYNTDQETIKKILKGCPKIKHVKCPKISIDIKFLDEIYEIVKNRSEPIKMTINECEFSREFLEVRYNTMKLVFDIRETFSFDENSADDEDSLYDSDDMDPEQGIWSRY